MRTGTAGWTISREASALFLEKVAIFKDMRESLEAP
jgi:hypothetical protein